MGRKRTLKLPDGRTVSAEEMSFRTVAEEWSEYVLEDGTVVRLRPVAIDMLRLEGEFDPQGNPVYVVNAQQVVAVSAPDELRKED